jgi:spore maturation protein SpmB
MKEKFKNIAASVATTASKTWKWLSGRKRWIAITAGLIAKLTPEHTFGHQATAFIRDNAETIFQVVGVIAIGEVVVNKAKEKLPSGLRKNTDGKN